MRDVKEEYFDWLCSLVSDKRNSKKVSYKKLLVVLHSREFYWTKLMDENRAFDGISLRELFAYENKLDDEYVAEALYGPCTVLEMMIALAKRIDDEYMGNARDWFWLMIANMGLNTQIDSDFERGYCEKRINILLDRAYEEDGKGGLFVCKNAQKDLTNVEIWYQMNWYINEICKK